MMWKHGILGLQEWLGREGAWGEAVGAKDIENQCFSVELGVQQFRRIAYQQATMLPIYAHDFYAYANIFPFYCLPTTPTDPYFNPNFPYNTEFSPPQPPIPNDNALTQSLSHESVPEKPVNFLNSSRNHRNEDPQKSHRRQKTLNPVPMKRKKEQSQKYGRNICSNIFHMIIKRVLYEKQYNETILKIIKMHGLEITLEEFFSKLYFKQNKLNEYVPFEKIIEFYQGHKNKIKQGIQRHKDFCKILRIISRLYLHQQHLANTYHNPKLKKDCKQFHINESRKLGSIVRGTYKQDFKNSRT